MHLHPATLLAAAVASFLLSAASASPSVPEPSEVLVVSNRAHPWSGDVADAYLHARQIPAEQVVVIDLPPTPLVSREVYQQRIEGPVARWLRTHDAFDRIRFIVLVPGVPLRVNGTRGRQGSTASVDSELALLYRRMTGTPVASTGFIENPYFSAGALNAPRPFGHQHYDIYLVTRLDGRTAADATALISRGAIRPTRFSVVVDGRPRAASGAEATWLAEVPARVQAAQPAARVLADESAAPIAGEVEVTGYASWGSNDVQARVPPVSFGAGAIASSFMSSDARTLESPPPGWVPGTWERPESFFAGSPEALAADWLQAGLTGLGAQVTEPYLDGAFRPATLQEAWVRGYTLAESFYLALPYLSWQAVVFGDPLARATDGPAPAAEVPTAGDTSGVTPFVARSAAVLRERQPALGEQAARLLVRANLSIAAGRPADAGELLEQVTVLAPGYTGAHFLLGQHYEAEGKHELARARYLRVLQAEPAHVIALNNLAYNLAVHAGKVAEALPIAERAARLAPDAPEVLDTVGWIRHLAGDSRRALDSLRQATSRNASMCESWAHLAVAERAAGSAPAARAAADKAISCDPALGSSALLQDVKNW